MLVIYLFPRLTKAFPAEDPHYHVADDKIS
jgi:hypothetical protein